jgi:hypothetical protein
VTNRPLSLFFALLLTGTLYGGGGTGYSAPSSGPSPNVSVSSQERPARLTQAHRAHSLQPAAIHRIERHDPCTTNSLFCAGIGLDEVRFTGPGRRFKSTLPQSLLRGADRPHFSCPSGRSASAVLRIEWRRAQGKNQSRKSERFTLYMLPRMHHEVVPAELLRIASKQGALPEMRSDPYTSLSPRLVAKVKAVSARR